MVSTTVRLSADIKAKRIKYRRLVNYLLDFIAKCGIIWVDIGGRISVPFVAVLYPG